MNREIPECSIYDEKNTEEQPVPSSSRILVDIQNRPLLEFNNAAFLDLTSSDDDESTDSHERLRLDEIPECGDFANWYSHESFSQPVQSSPLLKETQLTTNELAVTSRDKAASSICVARTVSDGVCMEKKRKKRTKDEILAEQAYLVFSIFFVNYASQLCSVIINGLITVVDRIHLFKSG